MRIISGKYRGTKLFLPPDDLIRPTSDRAKEMIFSTLNSIILKKKLNFDDMKVLDFFCGTGGLGIECISRGFKKGDNFFNSFRLNCINNYFTRK